MNHDERFNYLGPHNQDIRYPQLGQLRDARAFYELVLIFLIILCIPSQLSKVMNMSYQCCNLKSASCFRYPQR